MTFERAVRYTANALSVRMYTKRQIRDKLKAKDCDEAVIEAVIEYMSEQKFLNDLEYARMYIIDAVNIGSKGAYRIKEDLFLKGVPKDIIAQALSESEVDELEVLKDYITKRLAAVEIRNYKDIEKLKGHLFRKGYSIRDVNRALDELNVT